MFALCFFYEAGLSVDFLSILTFPRILLLMSERMNSIRLIKGLFLILFFSFFFTYRFVMVQKETSCALVYSLRRDEFV